jgi:lipoate-protein ligase A
MDWIVEEAFDRSGPEHMARDEELARALIADPSRPYTLRIYSWNPSAVSLGYQQPMDAVDLNACKKYGVDVVRRPTGGRAVLHANELTYAVIMRFDGGIYRTHNLIVDALLRSFDTLGARLDITSRHSDSNFRSTYA